MEKMYDVIKQYHWTLKSDAFVNLVFLSTREIYKFVLTIYDISMYHPIFSFWGIFYNIFYSLCLQYQYSAHNSPVVRTGVIEWELIEGDKCFEFEDS